MNGKLKTITIIQFRDKVACLLHFMIALFYNETSLHDTLIIHITPDRIYKVDVNAKFCIGYNDKKEICFINIFDVSKDIALPSGFLKLNSKLCSYINSITQVDLQKVVSDNPFVVAQVINCENIEGTHLHLCQVSIGDNKTLDIVCGAKNVAKNMKVVAAQTGAILPNGVSIISSKLMGHTSSGMLCSARELNLDLTEYTENGIIELSEQYQIGQPFDKVFVNN
jgi:tRNA-binding protein